MNAGNFEITTGPNRFIVLHALIGCTRRGWRI